MITTTQQNTPTETKAQQAERLKREKNPWECLEEIRAFARNGFESIPADWLGTYLRWWGVYTQGDGRGALGGKAGQGNSVPCFMVRIRVTNGLVRSHQLRAIADVAERHARGVADITVRQNVQLHWITIESLPDLLDTLWSAGLTTQGACGDDTRNITGCPLAGYDAEEICDTSPLALAATEMLVGNADYYNLPRKFKVCITGCPVWCSYPEINDVGLTATARTRNGQREIGFSLRVGGGLSTEPHFAVRLNAFVHWDQALPVVRAVGEIFRDSNVLRENRERARLKYLFLRYGWTAESFLAELERRLGFQLDPAEPERAPEDVYRDHAGIHRQRQPGQCYVGASVLRGRMNPAQMRTTADLAEEYGSGELRTTGMQNLLLVNVPELKSGMVAAKLNAVGLRTGGSPFWRGAVACTGTEFCKLAITETKGFARWLVEEMEDRMPDFHEQLKLNITGCPNGCGQHSIADVGLEGKRMKVDGQLIDAYYFSVGGGVGKHPLFTRPVGYRCAAREVPDALERVLGIYRQLRMPGENLREFFARHHDEEIRTFLAGEMVAAVLRDPSPGPVPHGVEG
ncbi:MAG TPA: nitrite/sulfite reductase [Terriglobia bacterium]|nr:nitrite/sulfite reductase [Terriglobia bacterium]